MTNFASIFDEIETGLLVLTPNHRTSVQLIESYGAYRKRHKLTTVCLSPNIFPVDIWLRSLWEDLLNQGLNNIPTKIILEPLQELFLWKAIIRDSAIGSGLLSLEGTANTVQEAWRSIQQWQIPLQELHAHATTNINDTNFYEDVDVFLAWLEEYEKRNQQNNLISLSQLLEQFILTLNEGCIKLPEKIMLLGFDNPPPLYQKLFAAFTSNGSDVSLLELESFKPCLKKKALNSQEQEMLEAAQWAKHTLENTPAAKIAIICPDLHNRNQELQRVFSNCFYPDKTAANELAQNNIFSSTASEKLSAIPHLATALMLLDLNKEKLPTLEVCQILRSPFILDTEKEEQARAALEFKLRKNSETIIRLSQLRYMSAQEDKPWHCPILATALMSFENLRQQNKALLPIKDWVEIIEQQLDIMGWTIPDSNQPLQQLWQNLLKDFIKLGHLSEQFKYPAAITSLKQLAHASKAALFFNQAAVQILSPVEATGLQYTHLWFMGLSEVNWPPASRSNPFIPLKIQKIHNLPAASSELQYQAAKDTLQHFIKNTSSEVVLSYPQQNEDLSVKPSMLLAEIVTESTQSEFSEQISPLHPYSQSLFDSKVELETLTEELEIALHNAETISGGTALIADQAICAFSSFAKHRLKATELSKVQYGLPAFAVGNMLHYAMELLWSSLKDQQTLLQSTDEQIQQFVDQAAEKALVKISRQYPHTMTEHYRALEAERLAGLLLRWLEEERQRGPFTIIEHEYSLQWQYSTLKLEFRIDRIEKLADETFGLVDYKTSKNNNNVDWLEERQDKPQLLLYLQAAENDSRFDDITSILYAQVNIEEMKYRGISKNADIYPGTSLEEQKSGRQKRLPADISWQELKEHWQASLESLAQEFLDGYVAINPKSPTSCQYCHLGALCRIQEKRKRL